MMNDVIIRVILAIFAIGFGGFAIGVLCFSAVLEIMEIREDKRIKKSIRDINIINDEDLKDNNVIKQVIKDQQKSIFNFQNNR